MKRITDLLLLGLVLVGFACASTEVDPRCTIKAPSSNYRGKIAQSVNGSKLWQAYFEHMAPARDSAQPLVAINLEMERKVTSRMKDGDYDPGIVKIRFFVTSLLNGSTLWEEHREADLKDFMIGFFDEKATREEIQAIAFEATEEDVFPYIARWVNLAAIKAMAQQGSSGKAFVPALEEQAQDPWADDLLAEAQRALETIRGGS